MLDFDNPKSEYGKLNGDNNFADCDIEDETDILFGRVNIVYFPNPKIQRRKHEVRVIHFIRFSSRPTNWSLTVVINGVVKLTKSKFSEVEGRKIIGTTVFQY